MKKYTSVIYENKEGLKIPLESHKYGLKEELLRTADELGGEAILLVYKEGRDREDILLEKEGEEWKVVSEKKGKIAANAIR